MKLRDLVHVREQRVAAMRRARHARTLGFPGIELDVAIARRANRLLIRMLRGIPL